jgi:hypothetical protein
VSSRNGRNPRRRRTPRPYRDSALAYGALGLIVVIIGYASGSGLARSLSGGIAAFVLATAWTWWRMRTRERAPERREP